MLSIIKRQKRNREGPFKSKSLDKLSFNVHNTVKWEFMELYVEVYLCYGHRVVSSNLQDIMVTLVRYQFYGVKKRYYILY